MIHGRVKRGQFYLPCLLPQSEKKAQREKKGHWEKKGQWEKKGKSGLPDECLEPSLFDNEVINKGGIREYLQKWRAEQEVLPLDPIQGPGTQGPSAGLKGQLPSMTSDERGGNAEEDVLEIEELAGSGEEREQAYFLRPGDMVNMKP